MFRRPGAHGARAACAAAALVLLFAAEAPAAVPRIEASNRYRSPRSAERRVRASTRLIVLHTTEAPARSSLNKVSERGECHYCVDEDGAVYAIVDRDREAFHAGRSMWRGEEDVDKFSIGIECVGHHDKTMPPAQIAAIRKLVAALKEMYSIPDHCVVCHSHVAYGAPNKWHKFKHRGRKRCGMLFAMPSVRRALGLATRPAFDADVRAGRLRNGDEHLAKVLYGGIDTMASAYVAAPKQKKPVAQPKPKATAKPAAQPKPAPAKSAAPKSTAELKARGYREIGSIGKGMTAIKIAGKAWNSPDTFYTIRDKVVPGDRLDPARVEKGMRVWMKRPAAATRGTPR